MDERLAGRYTNRTEEKVPCLIPTDYDFLMGIVEQHGNRYGAIQEGRYSGFDQKYKDV